MIQNILYRQVKDQVHNIPWRLVIPDSLRELVFYYMHDHLQAGHYRFLKTYGEIKKRYWWKTMYADTARYIAGCQTCQVNKQPNVKVPGKMVNMPTPDRVFRRIATDYIHLADLKQKPYRRKKEYALVMIDQVFRYVIAATTRQARGCDTIRLVERHLLAAWGTPEEIVCHNGSHFKNKVFKEFCEKRGIKLIFSTPYNPQSNGMVENANKTIKMYLST